VAYRDSDWVTFAVHLQLPAATRRVAHRHHAQCTPTERDCCGAPNALRERLPKRQESTVRKTFS
jgi:hypothetical protein